jgi:hypothetical protein
MSKLETRVARSKPAMRSSRAVVLLALGAVFYFIVSFQATMWDSKTESGHVETSVEDGHGSPEVRTPFTQSASCQPGGPRTLEEAGC